MEFYSPDWLWPIRSQRIEYSYEQVLVPEPYTLMGEGTTHWFVTIVVGPGRYYKRIAKSGDHTETAEFTSRHGKTTITLKLDGRPVDWPAEASVTTQPLIGLPNSELAAQLSDISFLLTQRALWMTSHDEYTGQTLQVQRTSIGDDSVEKIPCALSALNIKVGDRTALAYSWDPVNALLSNSIGPMRFKLFRDPKSTTWPSYSFLRFDLKEVRTSSPRQDPRKAHRRRKALISR